MFLLPASFKGVEGGAAEVSFELFLGEFVWTYGRWREDGWDEAQVRIGQAIDVARGTGQPVGLSLGDWEKLREAAKSADLRGPLAPKLRAMVVAITSAQAPVAANDAGMNVGS